MKILGISILLLVFLTGFSLGLDILSGLDLTTSIKNALNPFLVIEVAEFFLFFLLIIYLVVVPLRSFFRKKKQGTTKDKKHNQP
jgi:branched-subunit amino acid ABC-type transport system permease component